MEINVNIDSEKINKMLVESILQSTIGEEIQKSIKEYTKGLSNFYKRNNPIKKAV